MFRYYVYLTYQTPTGLRFGDVDINLSAPISTREDLAPIAEGIATRGLQQVQIRAFSLYAEPTDENPARPTVHAATAISRSRRPGQ